MAEDRKLSTHGMNWFSPTDVRNAHADANPGSVPPLTAGEVVVTAGTAAVASSLADDDDDCWDSYSGVGPIWVPQSGVGIVVYLLVLALFALAVCR